MKDIELTDEQYDNVMSVLEHARQAIEAQG
jgi:5-bromo-4-chloroindolyl phosphate hydrolysis protein